MGALFDNLHNFQSVSLQSVSSQFRRRKNVDQNDSEYGHFLRIDDYFEI